MKILLFKKRYYVLSGIILFIIVVLSAAPRIARLYIVKHSHELIGRDISIEKIRINYFTGTFRIIDLKLYEADAKSVFVSFRQLRVNLNYLPLLKNELFINSISLDDPYVQVLQDGTKFNFSDLIASDSSITVKDTIQKEPTKYIINNIRIARGFVKYTDLPMNHSISLDSLDLLIPGFTWNSDSANLDVGFNFVEGGGLRSYFEVNQTDSIYSVNLKLDSLNLGIIEPYVRNSLDISSLAGYLSGDLHIKGSMTSILKLSVSGIGHINGFQLLDTLQRTILSFNDLAVDIDTFQPEKNMISLNSISLKNPFILFELIDSTNNWLALMKKADQPDSLNTESDTTGSSAGISYNIPEVKISGGSILFADKTLGYPFEYKVDSIKLDLAEAPEMAGKVSFNVSAGLNGTGTFSSEGVLDPENPNNDIDFALEIGQFRMKDMDAYFRHYFGFPVTGGIMNFKTDNKLSTKSLISNNNIYFRRFSLAEKLQSEIKYKVPLRLALGVLSDKDGIIDLKAPVKMKGDDVKIINLGRIIFRIIGNLFVKAALSPLNLLSGLNNADPASLKEISLGLTEISPDEKNMKSLDNISGILIKKPLLNVDFIYCINRINAADSLAYLLTVSDFIKMSRYSAANMKAIPDTLLIRYIQSKQFAKTISDSSGLGLLCRNYIGEERLNAKLDSLRILQTGFISDYLSRNQGIAPERFRIIETTPDSIMPDIKHPSFRIYFTAGEEKKN
jgi:hypothetical protein